MSDNVIPFLKPPPRDRYFAHCRALCEHPDFDVEELAALIKDFGGSKLSEVPVERWRELMLEGTRRCRTQNEMNQDTDMKTQALTKNDPILHLAQHRDACNEAGNAAANDDSADPHFADLWETEGKMMRGSATSIAGIAAQLRTVAGHLENGDAASSLVFAPRLREVAAALPDADRADYGLLATLVAVRDLLGSDCRTDGFPPAAELQGLTNAIKALTALRMKAAS